MISITISIIILFLLDIRILNATSVCAYYSNITIKSVSYVTCENDCCSTSTSKSIDVACCKFMNISDDGYTPLWWVSLIIFGSLFFIITVISKLKKEFIYRKSLVATNRILPQQHLHQQPNISFIQTTNYPLNDLNKPSNALFKPSSEDNQEKPPSYRELFQSNYNLNREDNLLSK